MRSILESAFYALTNHDKEKSDALFREFMIERSRQIHEAIRVNGSLNIDELLKEDTDAVAVGVFAEATAPKNVTPVEQAPQAFLIVPIGDSFTVLGVTSEEEANNAAALIANLDGSGEGVAKVVDLDGLVDLLEVERDQVVDSFTHSITADAVGELFSDGIEGFSLDSDSAVFAMSGLTSVEAEDEVVAAPQEVDGEHSDGVKSVGADLSSLVDAFDAEIDRATLGEGVIDRLKSVDTIDVADQKSETGVADARNPGDAAPVVIKSSSHVGYEREKAPQPAAILRAKNTLDRADSVLVGAKAGEPEQTLVNNYGDSSVEPSKNIFDKKI